MAQPTIRWQHRGVRRLEPEPPEPTFELTDDERIEMIWLLLGRAAREVVAERRAAEQQDSCNSQTA
jgi:hypothetical protein